MVKNYHICILSDVLCKTDTLFAFSAFSIRKVKVGFQTE